MSSANLETLTPPAALPWTRLFYWSLRRELWEHRNVVLAPLAVAAFAVLVFFLSALATTNAERAAILADPAKAHAFMSLYNAVGGVILISGLVAGALYCLGALHGERRDRSILFWKSLPVSDTTTMLAKFAIPTLVLPLVILAAVVAANIVQVMLHSLVWSATGMHPAQLWGRLDLPLMWLGLLYGLPFMVLWYAPIYAWLLVVSAWARRAPLMWGLAPFAAMLIVEHLALHHTRFHWATERYLGGGVIQPYTVGGGGKVWIDKLSGFEPARVYTHPVLWLGVAVAALLLWLAIRLRRSRGPL